MNKLSYNPHNKQINTSFTSPRSVGRTVSIWMDQELLVRLQRVITENRLPSRSWVIGEAVYQYLEGIESLADMARRDKRELAEVPKITKELGGSHEK